MIHKGLTEPKKETNKCSICFVGNKLEWKNKFSKKEEEFKKAYLLHQNFKETQYENYKNNINLLKNNECMVIMDFKQNLVSGKGPIETSNDYYNKKKISCLLFCVTYNENCVTKRKYYNYFSEILNHDSLYVTQCIDKLVNNELKTKFNKIDFWSDNAGH